MKDVFGGAMRRAALLTRRGDVMGATRTIQAALAGGMHKQAPDPTRSNDEPRLPRPELRLIGAANVVLAQPDLPKGTSEETGRQERHPRIRKPLGEVLRILRAGRLRSGISSPLRGLGMSGTLRASSTPTIPRGAQFALRSFTCAAGTRAYKLYIPASLGEQARGLIVMLHGCKQNPDDFASGTNMNSVAEAHGLLIAYPAQPVSANGSSCWNWFNPADQVRGAGEPSIIAGITRNLMSEFSLDRNQVFVAGLSAGGAMALVMGETYPDLYAAMGIHSGLPYKSANDVMSAFAAMRGEISLPPPVRLRSTSDGELLTRIIVFQGSADSTVHPANANKILAADGRRWVAETEAGRAPGGRNFERSVYLASNGAPAAELWMIEGAGHAWSGGCPEGSYTDPKGPDASGEMVRFFLAR